MKKPRIIFSEKSLVLNFDDMSKIFKATTSVSLLYSDIKSITIENVSETKLFNAYESQRIVIRSYKLKKLIIYYGIKEFEHFDDYKNGLRKFAKNNRIKLIDNVEY